MPFFLQHFVELYLPVSTVEVHGCEIVASDSSDSVVASWGWEAKRSREKHNCFGKEPLDQRVGLQSRQNLLWRIR